MQELSPEAVEALAHYAWPGNVRELRSEMERAVVLSQNQKIELRNLSPSVTAPLAALRGSNGSSLIDRPGLTVQEAEKQLIIRALEESGGNRTSAAQKIGISRRTLHRKLHEYHLEGH